LSVSFNATNRTGSSTLGSAATTGGSSRRRNVPVKAPPTSKMMRPPTTPHAQRTIASISDTFGSVQRSVASTSSASDVFTAVSSGNMTPGSSIALGDDDDLDWEFTTHGLSGDLLPGIRGSGGGGSTEQAGVVSPSNLRKKRPAIEPAAIGSSKRLRKPSAKARECDLDDA